MSKKPVIVFEGIEGSGKTHHITNVSKYLKKKKLITSKYENQADV
jgi:dTMP kinase